jgi:hypothetical protein
LTDLIAAVGPIFIALDEIGAAFEVIDMDEKEWRDLFLTFCSRVLSHWFLIPDLHFLLLGRGSFLNYVGSRSGAVEELSSSPEFERLSLHFLRPPAIIQIFKQTFRGGQTLFRFYNLDDEKVKEAASCLYSQTTGHPRSLLQVFSRCNTYEELLLYAQGPYAAIKISKYVHSEFYRHISVHRNEIEFLLDCAAKKATVDLTQGVSYQGKFTPRELIVNNAYIAWEGTLEAALLEVSPATTQLTATYFTSLKEYLQLVQKSLRLSLDFPDVFEVMLMKRFQNLFQDPKCPHHVLPEFFDTPILGSFENLQISKTARPMPRIRHGGSGRCLQDTEACKGDWPFLLKDMDSRGFLCLKPPLRSASSDAIFVGDVMSKGAVYRYAIAIAAKNYGANSYVQIGDISDEIRKFNVMFKYADKRISRLNILIVCATNYGSKLKARFQGKNFFILSEAARNIHEVIVLDLSSPQNRAKFFGFMFEDPLTAVIEEVIAKGNMPSETGVASDV